eukprot:m.1318963 g.1318963  ORF g.1318963 m.1318963 type:complete len:915 (-) comp24843_c0_seq3:4607-7351(-)
MHTAQHTLMNREQSVHCAQMPVYGQRCRAHWRQELAAAVHKIFVGDGSSGQCSSQSKCPLDLALVLLRLGSYSPNTFELVCLSLNRKMHILISKSDEFHYAERIYLEIQRTVLWWCTDGVQTARAVLRDVRRSLEQRHERNAASGPVNPTHCNGEQLLQPIATMYGYEPSDWRSFSQCPIWNSSAEFYEKNAANSWILGPVPYVISNSRLHAQNVTDIIIGWIQDNRMGVGDKLVIFDIGAGVCQFGYHLCTCLAQREAMCLGVNVVVVLADVSEALVHSSVSHPGFFPYISSKQVDFVVMHPNGEDFGSGDLLCCGKSVTEFIADSDSIVFTANYLLDSLPTDLYFHTNSGHIHQILTRRRNQQCTVSRQGVQRPTRAHRTLLSHDSATLTAEDALNISRGRESHESTMARVMPHTVETLEFELAPPVLMTVQPMCVNAYMDAGASGHATGESCQQIYASGSVQQAFERIAAQSQTSTGFLMPVGALQLVENMMAAISPHATDLSVLLIATDKTYTNDMYSDARQPPPGFARHGDVGGEHCHSLAVNMHHLGAALAQPTPSCDDTRNVTVPTPASDRKHVATRMCAHAEQASTLFQTSCFVLREGQLTSGRLVWNSIEDGGSNAMENINRESVDAMDARDDLPHGTHSEKNHNRSNGATRHDSLSDALPPACLRYTREALLHGAGTFGGGDWEMLWTSLEDHVVDDVSTILEIDDCLTVLYRLVVLSHNDYMVFETLMWVLRRALIQQHATLDNSWLQLIRRSFSCRFQPQPREYRKQRIRLAQWFYSLGEYTHALEYLHIVCVCTLRGSCPKRPRTTANGCADSRVCTDICPTATTVTRALLAEVLLYVSCHKCCGTLPIPCIATRLAQNIADGTPQTGRNKAPGSTRRHRLVRRIQSRLQDMSGRAAPPRE